MIITRTPLRIGIAGGGTDIESSIKCMGQNGKTLNIAINLYVYVTVKRHSNLFKERYRLNYSETETVESRDKIKNEIIRKCLEYLNIDEPLYISSISDVPAGTGLGSSSAFCVGLLHALHVFRGDKNISRTKLAEEAIHVELNMVKSPIGIQDQIGCALGGLKLIEILEGQKFNLLEHDYSLKNLTAITDQVCLYWTNLTRSANSVLSDQAKNNTQNSDNYIAIKNDAEKAMGAIRLGDINKVGKIIGQSWERKRQLSPIISNNDIDRHITEFYKNNAIGCKLLGAGAGGFILVLRDFGKNKIITESSLDPIRVQPDVDGTVLCANGL